MNARNVVNLIGYFPNQEKQGKAVMYREGTDGKKSFYRGKISVRRAFKNKDGEYVSDWIPFTAFGHNADFIHNYINQEGGDTIAIQGEIQISENYEKDGQTIYGTPFVLVDSVSIVSSGSNRETASVAASTPSTAPAAKAAVGANPLAKLRNRAKSA